MSEDSKTPTFTLEQFRALSVEQQKLIMGLLDRSRLCNQPALTVDIVTQGDLTEGLELWAADHRGCVPDGYTEDVEGTVHTLFDAPVCLARDTSVARFYETHPLFKDLVTAVCVSVDVSVDDCTTWMVFDRDLDVIYAMADAKAWHFKFSSLRALATWIDDTATDILTGLTQHWVHCCTPISRVQLKLTEGQWLERFKPVPWASDDAPWNGCMHETFGDELCSVLAAPKDCVWTLLDCDGAQVIVSGYHHINRQGYFITAVSHKNLQWEVEVEDLTSDEE
jgi:hypothetical protein